jgi:ABC-type polysaccharide/polyol phosphate transport system ATPase subunit
MTDLSLRRVSKRYRLENGLPTDVGFARRLAARLARPRHDFWALRDVSLEVGHGETLGVIGHNGAGKSTLLKLLSRITAPSEGEIRIRGRLSALIELGSGFHPELTGRENLFLSGAILGMRRREIAAKLESIVDFAGVAEFIDVPVKWYSSGMYVRLGFAMAAHLDPDILLVDEVLSVGDASFQGRCFNRIAELKRAGTTIVLISHDLGSVERLSDRAVLLDHGHLVTIGRPADVISEYQRRVDGQSGRPRGGVESGTADICGIQVCDPAGRETATARTGDGLRVTIRYRASTRVETPIFDVFFYSFQDDVLQAHCASGEEGALGSIEGEGGVEFDLPVLGLQPGVYSIRAGARRGGEQVRPANRSRVSATLYVTGGRGLSGRFFMPHSARLVDPRQRATESPGERVGAAGHAPWSA